MGASESKVPADSLVLGEHAEALQALFPCAAGLQQARQDPLQGTQEGGKHSSWQQDQPKRRRHLLLIARILQHVWVTAYPYAIQKSVLHACNLQCIQMYTRASRALESALWHTWKPAFSSIMVRVVLRMRTSWKVSLNKAPSMSAPYRMLGLGCGLSRPETASQFCGGGGQEAARLAACVGAFCPKPCRAQRFVRLSQPTRGSVLS